MKVDRIFINCYRYDFHFAKICVASIRYWYPDVPIYLIKDEGRGGFNTTVVERMWDVNVLDIPRKRFGWGYGKLETLFLEPSYSFLVLDADTVLAGPVLEKVTDINADFIVDDEKQPEKRFNEIYYNLHRINEIDRTFRYPGYSFNSGQWFGTSGKITRDDFNLTLEWTEPPECRFPEIVFVGDQAHFNFTVHRLEQQNRISVARRPLMIWPDKNGADHIDLQAIQDRTAANPFIIHWAGMGNDISGLNRSDILSFYKKYYYSQGNRLSPIVDGIRNRYLKLERKVAHKLSHR